MKLFFDKNTLDNSKTVVSIRDGVQEYLGIELGIEPFDKIFKIYRSPETIKATIKDLQGLPVTNEHIELKEIDEKDIIGKIESSKIIDVSEAKTNTTLIIENKVKIPENVVQLLGSKNQLSLGYFADMREHDLYDFEQFDIQPHHLAIVKSGRCGDICKFKDERIPMEEIWKIWGALSDEDKKAFLNKVAPTPAKVEITDSQEFKQAVESFKTTFKDSDEFKQLQADKLAEFKDSQEFKDTVKQFADERVSIIDKAKVFLDGNYDFTKDSLTIMRDAIATQTKDEFKDEELKVAFKMLKKVRDYSKFADAKADGEWNKIADKEI